MEIPKQPFGSDIVLMISEPARPKLVTSIKTKLHPASEGAAAIATRHSVFAKDE